MTTTQTKTAVQLAEAVIDAFNRADWGQIRTTIAPAVIYTETGTQRRVENWEDYLQLLQGWKEAIPDARGSVLKVISQGNTAVQEVIWEGTQTGPLPTPAGILPPSGKAIHVPAAICYTVDNGLVQEVHHYLDVLLMLQQLGALPG